MPEAVENWEAIVHKTIRTRDGLELGNVVEVDDQKLISIQGVAKGKGIQSATYCGSRI